MDERRTFSPAKSFVDHYAKSYPPSSQYLLDSKGTSVNASSDESFRTYRENLLNLYFEGDPKHDSIVGHFIEPVVCLSLRPYLQEGGFDVVLAPQSLEHGDGQKGVDILITDSEQLVLLGIDVKSKKGRSSRGRDTYGWSPALRSPFVYLSLGNWNPAMQDRRDVSVHDWSRGYVVPNLQKSGQIPNIQDFRQYLLKRLERTVYSFRERMHDPSRFQQQIVPQTPEEASILEEKLGIVHSLITDVLMSKT